MKQINLFLTAAIILVTANASFSQMKFVADDGLNSSKPNSISFAKTGTAGEEVTYEATPNESEIIWSTSKETNTSHFELQISQDGINFTEIKKVAASDYTQWQTNYKVTFRKSYLSAVKVYYRLKAVFSDNGVAYSTAVVFNVAKATTQPMYANLH